MPIKPRCCNPFCCFSAAKKRPDPISAGAQTAPSESGPGVSHDVADVSGVPGCDKVPPSGSSNVSRRCNPFCCFSAVEKRPDPTSAGAQTAPSESGPGVSHDVADVSGVAGCDKAPPSGSSNVSGCCNPFCCFSAVEKRPDPTSAESGPGASHDVTDVPGVPGCYKAPPSGSSNVSLKYEGEDVDARLNVSGPPRCDDASSSGSSDVPKTRSEEEDVDVNLNASGAPPCINEASTSGSSNVPKTRSEEEDADVNLNVSGAPPCINEASTSGSSNVPNRSEEQDVDFNLNVSGDPRRINEAPSCSSSSGATKSRSDLTSSICKDVEVEDVNLDDLMNHISELLKQREEGKQQQASNISKFPWPNVPGLQKLMEIVSFGTDLKKLQNMLSAALKFGSELKDIIRGPVTAVLKEIGKVSVATAGLLVVAHTLEALDDAFTNNKKCWDLIKEMSYVASIVKRLKESPQGMAQFVIPKATSLLVEGAIMCCNEIGGSAWKKLFLSSKIKGDLSDIRQKLHAMYLQINTEIGFRLLSAVEREGRSPLSKGYPTHAVGIDEPIKEVLRLLEIESDQKAVTVILHGFGGTGKTTLGDAVFSEVGGCKYSKVRLFKDINSTPDIIELQKLILKDLVEPGKAIPDIRTHEDGQRELESVLANVDAFICIDNVLKAPELKKLLPHDITKAKKVRLLLTARDDGVKIACSGTILKIYKMKGIRHEEAMRILKTKIKEGINDSQFNDIIQACGGIPLMLTLAASFIGVDDNKQEAFSRLMGQKDKWIGDEFEEMRYAFAYDALPPKCKDPFLDICSYFKGWKWDIVQDIVGEDELRMLESRALVTKATNGVASVHDVILTLARQKSEEESNGKEVRKTFTRARELKKFLEEEDTLGIKGIWLARNYRDYGAALHICASRLDSMHNSLRVLHLETPTKVEGNCNKIFKELIYLKAKIIQLPFHGSQLKQLRYLSCEFPKVPTILQLMNFDGWWQSRAFQVLSTDFTQLQNLRVLIFNNFTELKELPKELGKLESLKVLKLRWCQSIRKLPEGFGQLKNLEELELTECRELRELCNDFRELPSLIVLKLEGCESIQKLPEGLDQLKNLELVLRRCRNLRELCNDFSSLSLQILDVSECDRLEQFPGDGSCPSTDISVQAFSISESQKENIENNVLSEFDRILTDRRGKPFHLSHLPPNTPVLVICDTHQHSEWSTLFSEPRIDEMQIKFEIIYIGPHVDWFLGRMRDRIFVIRLPYSRVQEVLKQVCFTLDAAVPPDESYSYLQMHTKTEGEKSDNYRPCWRFLTAGELEEFVVCNSGRYVRLKQLQAETDEKSSNIELLRELFAPGEDEDESTPVFQKKDSSRQVTTCGVDQLKGKTILLDLRGKLFDDIGLPSLKEMYDVVVKQKLDLEIITIPIDGIISHRQFSKQVPWFVLTKRIREVALFFLTKQCGWEEGDECEKWYASINCIIEPNGRVIPCRPFTKYREAKSTPILEFLFNHLERVSDQVKRIMFQVKWGVKACPTVHEEIENFKKEEWEQLKSMSTLEFLFNHLESTSDQVKKLMCQGKIICLHGGRRSPGPRERGRGRGRDRGPGRNRDHGGAVGTGKLDVFINQLKKVHIINVGCIRMESLLLTNNIYKNYCYPETNRHVSGLYSVNLSNHELMRFSSRLHYLKEEINRIKGSDKKLCELKSFLHSFPDEEETLTFVDQYGKVVATLDANITELLFEQDEGHKTQLFIKSMMKDVEGGGNEMHDKDHGVSYSLIQNMQTASTSLAVEQENMDAYFERLLEHISELWGVELYQFFKVNKDGKKSSPSRVTWPASRGFRMLENFLSEGTHANWVKDVISLHHEEVTCETVIKSVIKSLLKDIEEENWGVAGLCGVAYVLERFEFVSANQIEQCLLVLDEMVEVAKYIKQLNKETNLSWRRIKRFATVLIVIFSMAFSALIDPSKFALFEFATIDNPWLTRMLNELERVFSYGYGQRKMCDDFELLFGLSW